MYTEDLFCTDLAPGPVPEGNQGAPTAVPIEHMVQWGKHLAHTGVIMWRVPQDHMSVPVLGTGRAGGFTDITGKRRRGGGRICQVFEAEGKGLRLGLDTVDQSC